MDRSGAYYGASYDRYVERAEHSTTHKLKNAYWTTKQAVIQKFGRKEDEHVVSSDAELDAKLELFKSIQKTCNDLVRVIDRYQEKICALTQAENEMGRFLKSHSGHDKTQAGKMMVAVGKTLSFTAQQRLSLRIPLSRLQQETDTFRCRAVSDTMLTLQIMENSRTDYRGALLWMKNVSEELDPDTFKQLEKFRKVQAQVRKSKARFDKMKLDSMQKVDLLAASRCNLFSHVLVIYQDSLLHFWEKASRTMKAVAESFKGYQYYEFNLLRDLTAETRKLAEITAGRCEENSESGGQEETEGDDIDKRLEAMFLEEGGFASYPRQEKGENALSQPSGDFGLQPTDTSDSLLGASTADPEENEEDLAFLADLLSGGIAPDPTPNVLGPDGASGEGASSLMNDWQALIGELDDVTTQADQSGVSDLWSQPGRMDSNLGGPSQEGTPSNNLARMMPSALLDQSEGGMIPRGAQGQAPSSFDWLSGGGSVFDQQVGKQSSPAGADRKLTSMPTNPDHPAGSDKSSKSDIAAWMNLFAELDPLANPDKLSKKEGQISDA